MRMIEMVIVKRRREVVYRVRRVFFNIEFFCGNNLEFKGSYLFNRCLGGLYIVELVLCIRCREESVLSKGCFKSYFREL